MSTNSDQHLVSLGRRLERIAPRNSELRARLSALTVWWEGAGLAADVSRARARRLRNTPCSRWAYLHLVHARECLEFRDRMADEIVEAIRAAGSDAAHCP